MTPEAERNLAPEASQVVSPETDQIVILAAGALPWRRRNAQLEVVLVHRPRYDDWSWAKGKLDPGEEWPVAAVREVLEETGLRVRLGRPLPSSEYVVADRTGQPATKRVRYWSAEVVGGDGALVNEIDEVAWLDVEAAAARLSYERDRDQLRALVRADHAWTLATWPLVIVRHAKAESRSAWAKADPLRPLNARGRARAEALVPLLAAYGVTRVVTSPSVRCLDTVLPYSVAGGYGTRLKAGLSEEGFAERPGRATNQLSRLLEEAEAAVLCTHGPVLPVLLDQLAGIADSGESTGGSPGESSGKSTGRSPDESTGRSTGGSPGDRHAKVALAQAAERGIGKGEALVAHLVGRGTQVRVVAVERHPAP